MTELESRLMDELTVLRPIVEAVDAFQQKTEYVAGDFSVVYKRLSVYREWALRKAKDAAKHNSDKGGCQRYNE